MPLPRLPVAATVALAAGLLAAGPARADAIDGNWCAADGRNMTIRGPALVTPGGTRMQGDYTRHSFSYVVPTGEPGAGGTTKMVQLNEETIHVEPAGSNGTVEVWHRCHLQTS